MLNFKFIKRASVALILFIAVLWSTGVALAGFITVYPNERSGPDDNNAQAAAVEALPAKTDGEIVNCFDYYRFPSVQASFSPVRKSHEPGQSIYFKGELTNENDYPLMDGYLFARVARYNKNYTREGHDIVDEFFVSSGPQGREKFYLEGKEKKGVVFSWNAPANMPEGKYVVSFSFVVGKKMNLAGLSFTNEVVAGSASFEVKKSSAGEGKIFLERNSFTVNGAKYDHIGFWPRFDKGQRIEISGQLKNETSRKENMKLTYDLYYWDGLDDKNKISSRSEEVVVAPNSSRSFQYALPEMNETVYFLKITALAADGQKSIVNVRFASEQEKPRINFFSPTKFPVLKGETMTNFACFHNTADRDAKGKLTVKVFDETGELVQTLGYEGKITGDIMAVKKSSVAEKNYDYLKIAASLAGRDGRAVDDYELIYDCQNLNPKNQECAKIKEEKRKTAAGGLKDLFDKKNIPLGIVALVVIILLFKLFYVKKSK